MMGGDDDDGDTIVETQEISSENLFQLSTSKYKSSFSLNHKFNHYDRRTCRPQCAAGSEFQPARLTQKQAAVSEQFLRETGRHASSRQLDVRCTAVLVFI